jgi:hypothetical protein
MIFISIARNYAENRKLRGRLLITRPLSRNRVLGWALPMVPEQSPSINLFFQLLRISAI